MSRSVALARRNLFADRRRAAMAIGGIGSGLLLVLLLSGIFSGIRAQASEYVDASPADVFISQEGVRTMHMSVSSLAPDRVDAVRAVPGVAWAESLRYTGAVLGSGSTKAMSYVVAHDPSARTVGPSHVVSGALPGPGELLIDESAATRLQIGVGAPVALFGTTLRVSGISSGGTMAMNTTVFLSTAEFTRLAFDKVSFVLVGAEQGIGGEELARRIGGSVTGITAQSKASFAAEEGEVIDDTLSDMTRAMVGIGFLVSMSLVALTLTTVTLSNTREYGVIKALGGTSATVVRAVVVQALWALAAAAIVAVGLAVVLAVVISAKARNLQIVLEPDNVARTLGYALLVSIPAALLPIRRVLRIEPASVFRSGIN